jgi:hypothetical protein
LKKTPVRFHKFEIKKIKPKQKNQKKPSQTGKNRTKPSQTKKTERKPSQTEKTEPNRFEPVFFLKTKPKPVDLN